MKSRMFVVPIMLLAFLATLPAASSGQSLEEKLQEMAEYNAKQYIQPLITAFGTNMNSGLYHTAKVHKMLGFDFKINVMMDLVPDEETSFDFALPDLSYQIVAGQDTFSLDLPAESIYPDRTSPTFFGEDAPVPIAPNPNTARAAIETQLEAQGATPQIIQLASNQIDSIVSLLPEFAIPGIGVQALPLFFPQISVGLPFHIEVMLRGFPSLEVEDRGKISFFGFGIKHQLDQYIPIPMFPVAIAAQFGFTTFRVGDILESNHTNISLQVSKSVPFLTAYAGFGIDNSGMTIKYTMPAGTLPNQLEDQEVEFDIDGENGFRATFGIRLKLLLLSINADYSLGHHNVATIGVGLTLR